MNNIRVMATAVIPLFLTFLNALADTSYPVYGNDILMGKDFGMSEPVTMLLTGIIMLAVAALQRKSAPNRSRQS